jgi:hypothetical protein
VEQNDCLAVEGVGAHRWTAIASVVLPAEAGVFQVNDIVATSPDTPHHTDVNKEGLPQHKREGSQQRGEEDGKDEEQMCNACAQKASQNR